MMLELEFHGVRQNSERFDVLCMLGRLLEEGPFESLLRNEALTRRGAEKDALGGGDIFTQPTLFTCNQHIWS